MNEMKRTANFGDNRPIYLQISGWICEKILRGEWVADQRIPSLRELGVLLEVNPNTVVRTCEYLLSQGVIYNRRGARLLCQRGCRRTDPHPRRAACFTNKTSRTSPSGCGHWVLRSTKWRGTCAR